MDSQHKMTIYVSPDLKSRLKSLPPRSVSRICRDALESALAETAEREQRQRDVAISEAFGEDLLVKYRPAAVRAHRTQLAGTRVFGGERALAALTPDDPVR